MHILFGIGRVLFVVIFIVSGAMKLLSLESTSQMIAPVLVIPDMLQGVVAQAEAATGQKWPYLVAIFIGVLELVGGLLIAFNIGTRATAVVLAIFTLVATFYFHDFWNQTGAAMQNNMTHALKNLSIFGGLLVFVVLGSWRPIPSNQI